jgi:hypothetical protein
MKKILLVAAIMVAVLAFLALPKGQAGAAKGKPIPIRWMATFVAVTDANLMGLDNQVFVGGAGHVNINNGSETCVIDGSVGSFLELQLFDPGLIFENMGGFLHWGNPDPAAPDPTVPVDLYLSPPVDLAPYGFPNYVFPYKNLTMWPDCVADFLNDNVHPTADYYHIILRFSTCGCGSANLMDMPVTDPPTCVPVRMSLQLFSHIWDCPSNSPFSQSKFLNLMMKAHGYYTDRLGDLDVKIQRTTEKGLATWTAYVDTEFDNPDYQDNLPDPTSASWATNDNILGQYATCKSSQAGKKGKTTWTTTYHYPWAKAHLKFQIKFWTY